MAPVSDLIKYAIRLALALSALGQLPQATYWLVKEAARRPQLVSLGRLNRGYKLLARLDTMISYLISYKTGHAS
jgi:hypothetical protein